MCPTCRQAELIWINHTDDDDSAHTYCPSCDRGICEEC